MALKTSVSRSSSSPLPVRGNVFAQIALVNFFDGVGQFRHGRERAARQPPAAEQAQNNGGQADLKNHFAGFAKRMFRRLAAMTVAQLLGNFPVGSDTDDQQRQDQNARIPES